MSIFSVYFVYSVYNSIDNFHFIWTDRSYSWFASIYRTHFFPYRTVLLERGCIQIITDNFCIFLWYELRSKYLARYRFLIFFFFVHRLLHCNKSTNDPRFYIIINIPRCVKILYSVWDLLLYMRFFIIRVRIQFS